MKQGSGDRLGQESQEGNGEGLGQENQHNYPGHTALVPESQYSETKKESGSPFSHHKYVSHIPVPVYELSAYLLSEYVKKKNVPIIIIAVK